MKLLNKENLLLLPVYIAIFLLVGVAFYFAAQLVLHENVEERLLDRKEYLLQNMDDMEVFRIYQDYSFHSLEIDETHLPLGTPDEFKDTVLYDKTDKEHELTSQLSFVAANKGKNYRITLRRAIVNTSEWAIGIAQVVIVMFFTLLLLLFIANTLITKRIWSPFYILLDRLKQFKISTPGTIEFPSTNITEFKQLSEVLSLMIGKIQKDYVNLKKFSENASHEFQTPLSVIQLKLDMLLQSPHLSDEELQLVNSAQRSLRKLSKLNEALLLLTKLENRQFGEIQEIDLTEIVKEKMDNLSELVALKSIKWETNFNGYAMFLMNPVLADLLIENLLSNAIKHNVENGTIRIESSFTGLTIKNSGAPLLDDPEKLFGRFSKSLPHSSSLGLGLAIVKEICNTYDFNISYEYASSYHQLSIRPHAM